MGKINNYISTEVFKYFLSTCGFQSIVLDIMTLDFETQTQTLWHFDFDAKLKIYKTRKTMQHNWFSGEIIRQFFGKMKHDHDVNSEFSLHCLHSKNPKTNMTHDFGSTSQI